jgi:hypothetical protein
MCSGENEQTFRMNTLPLYSGMKSKPKKETNMKQVAELAVCFVLISCLDCF